MIIFHLIQTIFSFWENIAISLPIHRLCSKCSSNQEYIFTNIWLQRYWIFQKFYFDTNKLLWSLFFSLCSIMISTWLIIKLRENRVLLSINNLSKSLQGIKLPTNKWIIIWIHWSSNERSSPIYASTKCLQIISSFWWKKFNPIVRWLELWNFFFRNTNLNQDFILC